MAAKNHIEDNEERLKQERAKTKQRVAGRSKKKKKKILFGFFGASSMKTSCQTIHYVTNAMKA